MRFLWGYLYCARRRRSRLLRLEAALQTSHIKKMAGGIIMQFLLMTVIISAKIPTATLFSRKKHPYPDDTEIGQERPS